MTIVSEVPSAPRGERASGRTSQRSKRIRHGPASELTPAREQHMRATGAGPEDDQASERGAVGATVERACGQTDGIASEWNPSFASGSPLPGVIIRTPTSASTTQL